MTTRVVTGPARLRDSISSAEPEVPQIVLRLRAHWVLKLVLLVALTAGFCVPYIFLAHHAFFSVHRVPETIVDRWATFDPRWTGVYQSIYLLIGFLPGLAATREQLIRYAIGFILLTLVSLPIFLFCPTHIDRPTVDHAAGLYRMLLMYDGPYNALPSLHAGFLYLTLAWTARTLDSVRPWMVIAALIWSALILWSTLTTKEHHLLDLVAGIALAAGCDWIAWLSSARNGDIHNYPKNRKF